MSESAGGERTSRERSRLSERYTAADAESSASLDGMSADSRKPLKGQRMRRSSGPERARGRERENGSEGVGRRDEAVRKRKRSASREQAKGGETGHEPTVDPHPCKRLERIRPENDNHSGEDSSQGRTASSFTKAAEEHKANPDSAQSDIQITVDSNGMTQILTGSPSDDALQDALLLGGGSLPPRPSSAHASDHEFETPFPTSVREELLSAIKSKNTPRIKPFSLLVAFCRNNDLLLTLISYLPTPSIISLYAISKTFHYLFNRHHTAFILSSMRTWAPNANAIYPWRCYKSLCTNDPILRQKMKHRGLDEEEAMFRLGKRGRDLRDVPTLRWLQMVVWRQGVCKDMLVMLATKGLRCPPGTLDAVKVSAIDVRD